MVRVRRIVLVAAAGLALGVVGRMALAKGEPDKGPKNEALICHRPGVRSEKTIGVGAKALEGRLRHGDYRGRCLFDAHLHLNPAVRPKGMLARVVNTGVSGVVLFGRTNDLPAVRRKNPGFVFPFVQLPRDPRTKELLLNEESVGLLREALEAGGVYGIGELPLRHFPFPFSPPGGDNNPADGPLALRIYDLAADVRVPVNVHVEHEFSDELERALAHNRNAVIIWAHMGDAPASLVLEMMRRHPNLYADISARNPLYRRRRPAGPQSLTREDGTLKEEWREVFEAFPGRFMFGTDVGPRGRLNIVEEVVAYYRSVLAQLTPSTAEKIANGNIKRLLGLRPRHRRGDATMMKPSSAAKAPSPGGPRARPWRGPRSRGVFFGGSSGPSSRSTRPGR
ncbi:MAG: amidohydrolase family protein [Nitrospinota bacterium]